MIKRYEAITDELSAYVKSKAFKKSISEIEKKTDIIQTSLRHLKTEMSLENPFPIDVLNELNHLLKAISDVQQTTETIEYA